MLRKPNQTNTRFRAAAGREPFPEVMKNGTKFKGALINYYASSLRHCGSKKSISEGRRIHQLMVKNGLEHDRFLGNLLVQMYGNCGALKEAQEVFDTISGRNIFSWNIMIGACVQCRSLEAAKDVFHKMPERNEVSWSAMIAAFGHSGSLLDARRLFDQMPNPKSNLISWNTMISTYAKRGHCKEAVQLFEQMRVQGPSPDKVTFLSILDTCDCHAALPRGKYLHSVIMLKGFDLDLIMSTALVNMYGKCGGLKDAQRMFDKLPSPDVVSWNVLLGAHAECGNLEAARMTFDKMPERTVVSWNSMIAAYSLHGNLEEAQHVFDRMPQRNIISWTSMIAAYAQQGHVRAALSLLQQLKLQGIVPNEFIYASIINACTSCDAPSEAKQIHDYIVQEVLSTSQMHQHGVCSEFEMDIVMSTAILNMYGKYGNLEEAKQTFNKIPNPDLVSWNTMIAVCAQCGSLKDAERIFQRMPKRNVVSWNAIVGAHAQHGIGRQALDYFQRMQEVGMMPNNITFVSVLNACSHSKMINECFHCFSCTSMDYRITPILIHYDCMVDILGRWGWLENAEDLINSMPFKLVGMPLLTLLSACKKFDDIRRGNRVAEDIINLDYDAVDHENTSQML